MNTTVQRLRVLYTGGTIGMQMSNDGLAPAGGFEARLREAQRSFSKQALPEWSFKELAPLLDSANMAQRNWLTMRDEIVAAYEKDGCDAVLVLHGTDTLAYSAGALSFLLLDLPIPVVLTGSMQPAGAADSDAWPNLFGAMQALAEGVRPGVHVFFNGRLMHGARVSKLRSDAPDAFHVLPRRREASPARTLASIDFQHPRSQTNIAILPLFPGLQAHHIEALATSRPQALLLECYGSGTGPSDNQEILAALREAHRAGTVLAAISQCPNGHIAFDTYAAGSRLRDVGLVSGGGMTREAALGKLFALLGMGMVQKDVEHWFAQDLCGEMHDDPNTIAR
ncbi:asparaginase [Pseudomonas matsuisoli]|uniref:L-asparaginase 1 n=1 Tax=Pseudomonas matsuisoli TaxID=1515666 RepID=A0A917UVE0_9PSED|nr:asparaginase [Pseudomonas matsuisoli]GGJ89162.1 L-asparaginase 1 [Pseudomonas matsuisoli]